MSEFYASSRSALASHWDGCLWSRSTLHRLRTGAEGSFPSPPPCSSLADRNWHTTSGRRGSQRPGRVFQARPLSCIAPLPPQLMHWIRPPAPGPGRGSLSNARRPALLALVMRICKAVPGELPLPPPQRRRPWGSRPPDACSACQQRRPEPSGRRWCIRDGANGPAAAVWGL